MKNFWMERTRPWLGVQLMRPSIVRLPLSNLASEENTWLRCAPSKNLIAPSLDGIAFCEKSKAYRLKSTWLLAFIPSMGTVIAAHTPTDKPRCRDQFLNWSQAMPP